MAENSAISWTTHTANFWAGCVKVSALCDHCYAERDNLRYGREIWGTDARRVFVKNVWNNLPKWNKEAQQTGTRPRVFVMSWGDFFENLPDGHPDKTEMEHKRMHGMEAMDTYDNLDFLVLTKRISNVRKMVLPRWLNDWPANVRLGLSVGTQKDADRDIPRLLELPCPNFLSMEPLLESVDIRRYLGHVHEDEIGITNPASAPDPFPGLPMRDPWVRGIEWVITGGESGPHAHPSHPDWFRSLRDQCRAAGVPFHFKQHGEYVEVPEAEARYGDEYFICRQYLAHGDNPERYEWRLYPWKSKEESGGAEAGRYSPWRDVLLRRVGKKSAGHLLDGEAIQEFPKAEAA